MRGEQNFGDFIVATKNLRIDIERAKKLNEKKKGKDKQWPSQSLVTSTEISKP